MYPHARIEEPLERCIIVTQGERNKCTGMFPKSTMSSAPLGRSTFAYEDARKSGGL